MIESVGEAGYIYGSLLAYYYNEEGKVLLTWRDFGVIDLEFKEDGIYTHGFLFSDLDFEEEFDPANPPASYGLYKLSYDGKGHTKVKEADILPLEE